MKTANRFEISSLLEDIIETSQVVLNFCQTCIYQKKNNTILAFETRGSAH
jgi:hypothetical protein